jgi:hypothetical protein
MTQGGVDSLLEHQIGGEGGGLHGVAARGLAARPYFKRHAEDAVDSVRCARIVQFTAESNPARTLSRDGFYPIASGPPAVDCSGAD